VSYVYLSGALLAASVLCRALLFCLALFAHHRWRIPIADLERLILACFPRRDLRRHGRVDDREIST
jgi:hypothetical protein